MGSILQVPLLCNPDGPVNVHAKSGRVCIAIILCSHTLATSK